MKQINALLVDSDVALLDRLAARLRETGLLVAGVTSASEALELLHDVRPEVIVSEISMPWMNGYELCHRIRRHAPLADTPVILWSSGKDRLEPIKALRLGADDYALRSANVEEMVARVQLHITRVRTTRKLQEQAASKAAPGVLNGALGDISVPELLQVVGFLGLDGVRIQVETGGGTKGAIHLSARFVLHAELGEIDGRRAFDRLIRLRQGTFRIFCEHATAVPTIFEPLDKCLLEGLICHDHYNKLQGLLGPGGRLEVDMDSEVAVSEDDVQMLSLIEANPALDALLESSPWTELKTLQLLRRLMEEGVVSAPGADRKEMTRKVRQTIAALDDEDSFFDETMPVRNPAVAEADCDACLVGAGAEAEGRSAA